MDGGAGGGVGSIGPLDDFTWKSVHVSKTLFSFWRITTRPRSTQSHLSRFSATLGCQFALLGKFHRKLRQWYTPWEFTRVAIGLNLENRNV